MVMKHQSVSTAHRVKEIIELFEPEKIFSTQELLRLIGSGSRNSIDLALSRLVKNKVIKRLAHGVFSKSEATLDTITPFQVATVKAKAFGKTIQLSGKDAAYKVGITNSDLNILEYDCNNIINRKSNPKESKSEAINTYTFYTSGSSSSFHYGNKTIKFVSASQRKRELPDDISGMVLKAVWHLGHSNSDQSRGKAKYITFNQNQNKRQSFRKYIRTVPNWLAKSLFRPLA